MGVTCVMPGATRTSFQDNSGSSGALVWQLPLFSMEADEVRIRTRGLCVFRAVDEGGVGVEQQAGGKWPVCEAGGFPWAKGIFSSLLPFVAECPPGWQLQLKFKCSPSVRILFFLRRPHRQLLLHSIRFRWRREAWRL